MIDSQAKRLSAIATRRLPWFRRFQPQPDGSIDQGDRQQLGYVYRGILAEEPAVVVSDHILGTVTVTPLVSGRVSVEPLVSGTVKLNQG